MSDILPPVIPPILPSLSGPALSFSSVRKVTDASKRLLDDLNSSIRTSIQSGLAAAAREGARIETKVANNIRKQLNIPEQLIEHVTSLVQNSIAGNLAQAVTTFEDLATNKEATSTGVRQLPGSKTQGESFVFAPATSQQATPGAGSQRAERLATTVLSPPVHLDGGISSKEPDQSGPGALCPIPSRAMVIQINKDAQDIATLTDDPGGQDLGAGYYGFDVNCCLKNTMGSPHDLEAQYPPDWLQCRGQYNGIDYGPDCKYVIFELHGTAKQQDAGVAYILKQLNPTGIVCGRIVQKCPDGSDPPCPPPPPPPPLPPVCCPPVVIPPCPPIPPLPSCIQVDFCDWEKLCETLKNCLKQTSADDCALDNETAYVYKDCDGTYGDAQKEFIGSIGKNVVNAGSMDDVLKIIGDFGTQAGEGDFSGPDPY